MLAQSLHKSKGRPGTRQHHVIGFGKHVSVRAQQSPTAFKPLQRAYMAPALPADSWVPQLRPHQLRRANPA